MAGNGAVIVGFTGTQHGMTSEQEASLRRLLSLIRRKTDSPYEFHHGACVGADDEAAKIAREQEFWLVAWEGPDPQRRAKIKSDVRNRAPKAPKEKWGQLFLDRNGKIVTEAEVMIAAPRQNSEILRSGTWSTIRRARQLGMTVYIVQPDGRIDKEWKQRTPGSLVDRRIQFGVDLRRDNPG